MLNLIGSVGKREAPDFFSFLSSDNSAEAQDQDGFLVQLNSLLNKDEMDDSAFAFIEEFDLKNLSLVLQDAELDLDEEQDFLPQISNWLVEQGLAADLSPVRQVSSVEVDVDFENLEESLEVEEIPLQVVGLTPEIAEELEEVVAQVGGSTPEIAEESEEVVTQVGGLIPEVAEESEEVVTQVGGLIPEVAEELEEVVVQLGGLTPEITEETDEAEEVLAQQLGMNPKNETELAETPVTQDELEVQEKTEEIEEKIILANSAAEMLDEKQPQAAALNATAGVANAASSSTSSSSATNSAITGQQNLANPAAAANSEGFSNSSDANEQQKQQAFTQQALMQAQQKINPELQQVVKDVLSSSSEVKASNDSLVASVSAASEVSENKRPSLPNLASINYPLRHPNWPGAVGKRLTFMINNQLQQAQITLNPDKLGPIKIRLQIEKDSVSVSMTAQHGMTREALEQAIPRLRDILNESGIKFSELNVQDEAEFNHSQDQQSKNKQQASSSVDGEEVAEQEKVIETDNLIDYYA